ncbi:hypothetical protein WME99_18855 [Sorangium sp. So ce136]|uniref:hypothetical protein n=1 Tax=Sorangium sp. So ce136 TaxID=3133284 RepID=UPI003F06E253
MILRGFIKHVCIAGLAALPLLSAGAARADVVDCSPERVRASSDRLDMRCTGIDRWFIAWRSSTNVEHFNNMLALLNSSMVAGKPVKLYYNLDSGNGILWAVELFR